MMIVTKARNLAKQLHRWQKRKYTGEPYFTHPAAVVEILARRPRRQSGCRVAVDGQCHVPSPERGAHP